jgi:SAM-dependent methyltransferase
VEARVSGPFAALARTRKGKWAFWKFHWLANQGLVRALERARGHARGALLDVGCGSRPFAWLFEGRVARYWGTDLRSSSYLVGRPPDAFASAEAQPIRNGSMDTVLGLSMMTYLPEPGRMLAEAHRVLKPGGTLILEFTQMVPLHDEPSDFFRFTRYGAAWLLERAGFEVVEAIPVGSLWARVGTSLTEPLNRINRGPTRVLTELPVRLLYVLIHLGFGLLDRVAGDPREVLAHVVVARRRG